MGLKSKRSIAVKVSIILAVVTILSTVISSVLVYQFSGESIKQSTISALKNYTTERIQRERSLFVLATQNHKIMKERFLAEIDRAPDSLVDEFDRRYLQWPDGSLRNPKETFDGTKDVGLYLSPQKETPSPELKKRLMLMSKLTDSYGTPWRNKFQDSYFTGPENFIVILWPEVPTWAQEIKSDFDLTKEEYFLISDKTNNPTRSTAWTGLFYDVVGKTYMVSVETPIDDPKTGKHLATFGHDITLNEFLDRTINDAMPSTVNTVIRADGRLIAHAPKMDALKQAGGVYLIPGSGDRYLENLLKLVKNMDEGQVIIEDTMFDEFHAVGYIPETKWYFITSIPRAVVMAKVKQTAQLIAFTGLFFLLIQLAFMWVTLFRNVIVPLGKLSSAADEITGGKTDVRLAATRQDEIGSLESAMNTMLDSISERDHKLRDYATSLESTVQLRTQEIRTVLDNVSFGLFICDKDMTVQGGLSRSCEEFFGEPLTQIVGRKLTDIMKISEREASHLNLLYHEAFDGMLGPEIVLSQLPKRILVNHRTLSFNTSPIYDGDVPIGVLFSVADATALAAAEREVEANRCMIQIMRNREYFKGFVGETDEAVQRLLQYAASGKEEEQSQIRKELHTLKGNFGSFGLSALATMIHHLEDHPQIIPADIQRLQNAIKVFLTEHEDILGLQLESTTAREYRIPETEVTKIEEAVRRSTAENELAMTLMSFLDRLKMKPAGDMIGPLADYALQLAKRLGKDIEFEKRGWLTPVSPNLLRVFQNLTHLVRNAVDHGIESPEERGTKPAVAKIILAVSETDDRWEIEVSDDGRGMDADSIAAKAVEKGLLTKEKAQSLSQSEKLRLIFHTGLSTASEVTEVSGRGIGTTAIEDEVRQLGGHITVTSKLGHGSSFLITIVRDPAKYSGQIRAA